MKFQDSSLNILKGRVGTKKCDPRTNAPCHAPTHAHKAICPTNFLNQVGGINILSVLFKRILTNIHQILRCRNACRISKTGTLPRISIFSSPEPKAEEMSL